MQGTEKLGSGTSSSTSVSNQGGKGKQTSVCWTCGNPGHFSDRCPQRRVKALVEELWNSDLGTWDEGGFGDQYAGSLDDFVDQLCGGVPTSTPLGSQTRLGMTCGMILGILLRWRSLNFPKGMKAPLRLRLALLVPRLEQLRLLHHQDLHFPKPRQGLPRLQLL